MTTNPKAASSRVGTLAKTACVACRRLKMKCVGAQNPPCARCAKVGRKCVVPPVMIHQQTITPYNSTDDMIALANQQEPRPTVYPLTPILDSRREDVQQQPWGQNHAYSKFVPNTVTPLQQTSSLDMPFMNIASSKPVWTAPQRPPMSAIPHSYSHSSLTSLDVAGANGQYMQPPLSASEVNISSVSVPATPLSHGRTSSGSPKSRRLPSDEELSHLCRFFIINLLIHIPVVTEADVGDYQDMVEKNKRPLANCMAYVAARFVPGCRSIRAKLTPQILSMLKLRFAAPDRNDDERLMLLQSFAILYTWATPQDVEVDMNTDDTDFELRRDVLRSSMEMLALRYSVHRAGEDVVRLLHHDPNDIRQSFALRKYCYWLWLFSSAHFQSLLSRTPPTLREDASIRWANQHLEQYVMNDENVRRILADVSLSLLWSRSSASEPDIGEWWCSISNETDANFSLGVLNSLDDRLNHWQRRWLRHQQRQPSTEFASDPATSSWIDFYQRFTRFCISTHATKLLQSSAMADTPPLPAANLITQSVERASTFCRLFVGLTPLVKSSIRFAPESTFAMVAFACKWIIRAQRFCSSLDCVKPNDLNVVQGLAELMVDLGIDNKHSARVYGENILAKLQAAMRQQPKSASWNTTHHEQPWATPGPMGSRNLIESVTAMDGVWPMRNSPIQRPQSTGPYLGLAIASSDGSEVFPNYHNGPDFFHFDPSWSI